MTDKRKFDIRLSQRDFNMLERRARRCKISKSEYMRRLLNRCVPREAPPLDYYGLMNEVRQVREDLGLIAQMAAATGLMDAPTVERALKQLQAAVEKMSVAVVGYYDEDE